MKKERAKKYKKIADPVVDAQRLEIGKEIEKYFFDKQSKDKNFSKNEIRRIAQKPLNDQFFNRMIKGGNYQMNAFITICNALDLEIKIVKKC